MTCPCCSGKEFKNCCEPYLTGEKTPETAEALMRSRYVAIYNTNLDYLLRTHDPRTRENLDEAATKKWMEQSRWLGLEIVQTEKGLLNDKFGSVEFKAYLKMDEQTYVHHELSQFNKFEDRWYFSKGEHL